MENEINIYDLFSQPKQEATFQTPTRVEDDIYNLDFGVEKKKPVKLTPAQALAKVAAASTINISQPVEVEQEVSVETEFIRAVRQNVVDVISSSDAVVFNSFQLLRGISPRLLSSNHSDFVQALEQLSLLIPVGSDQFGVIERMNPDTYWPGVTVSNGTRILCDELIDHIVINSKTNSVYPEYHLENKLLAMGVVLTDDEAYEFYSHFSSHSRITPKGEGFIIARDIVTDIAEFQIRRKEKEQKQFEVNDPRQIGRAIREFNRLPEVQKAKDLEKNKADNRRKGKNRKSHRKRLQGRVHNQTKTIEQLIAEMNKKSQTS